jgi:hypothetical protein
MNITIHMAFLSYDDPEASLAFYREKPDILLDAG